MPALGVLLLGPCGDRVEQVRVAPVADGQRYTWRLESNHEWHAAEGFYVMPMPQQATPPQIEPDEPV
jgi:hypothetical protein